MVLTRLNASRPLHGSGIARNIEQISGDRISLNCTSFHPALLKLEQDGLASVGQKGLSRRSSGRLVP